MGGACDPLPLLFCVLIGGAVPESARRADRSVHPDEGGVQAVPRLRRGPPVGRLERFRRIVPPVRKRVSRVRHDRLPCGTKLPENMQ